MADDYEGVTVAGLAVVAADTGYVLLAQRTLDETDDDDVKETWEFPGGHLDEGEEPLAGAVREFAEELGFAPPEGEVVGGWRSEDGKYQGFVWKIPYEINLDRWVQTDEVQAAGWFNREGIEALGDKLRPEVAKTDWSMIFAEEPAIAASGGWCAPSGDLTIIASEEIEEDWFDDDAHGDFADGDFEGKIPFHGTLIAFDEVTASGVSYPSAGSLRFADPLLPVKFRDMNDDVVASGVITRFERDEDNGTLRYEGHFDDEAEGAEETLAFLADFDRLGITSEVDDIRDVMIEEESGTAIHADARITGATITATGDTGAAYIALGPLTAARGPGWVTNPRETSRLHRYWTKGPGAAKIRWGSPGDWTRCTRLVGAKIAQNSPGKLRFIKQICARWHHDALGYWPGDLGKPGNAPNRASVEPLTAALSAASIEALPPEWFQDQGKPEMGFEYDEATGLTRVWGMIAENRRCHIGYTDRCVTPPKGDGKYRYFRKGKITTTAGEQPVGVLVYQTGHASHKVSPAEAAAHYDNTGRAWSFVNVGNNRQGIWFAGVVNPELSEQAIWAIKAGGAVSGDWRGIEGRHEMIAAVSVNVPGYPQPLVAAAYDADGELTALTAAGIVLPDREERAESLREIARGILNENRREALLASVAPILRESRVEELRALAREAL